MDFDLFEKLSDLETRIYVLEKELEEKDALIQSLKLRNTQLEQGKYFLYVPSIFVEIESQKHHHSRSDLDLGVKCDLASIESEVLRETSESVVRHTGYAFDERTGLYFDHISGYYYDPEHHLFFEPRTGTYYSYNSETGEYAYRSSVDSRRLAELRELFGRSPEDAHSVPKQRSPSPLSRHRSRHRRRRCRRRSRTGSSRRSRNSSSRSNSSQDSPRYPQNPRRHSACSDASPEQDALTGSMSRKKIKRKRANACSPKERFHSKQDKENIDGSSGHSTPPAQQVTSFAAKPMVYPPGVRLVVLASECAPLGSVFILTSEESSRGWGCIGRNPTFCPSVNFPDDPDVSTIHCEVIYNQTEENYSLLDRESSSGTFVNGQLLPKAEPVRLSHGDVLRIGATRLLVHLHRGSEVCDQCDPDTLRLALEEATDGPPSSEADSSDVTNGLSAAARRDLHRRVNIDILKEKYGIRYLNSCENPKGYVDRAAQRRAMQATGIVDTPHPPNLIEPKPVEPVTTSQRTSSLSTPIGAENRGAQLLAKMGWKDGEGLGKNRSGIVEPVPVAVRLNARAGFGSEEQQRKVCPLIPADATPKELQKARIRVITRDRYDKIQ
ncbi:g-patch domain protein [Opisthorchis viverrini]|uniref:G-patch domain protein n=1 Tax=Opisthorchis viverrini TaxID=6198 RepID=A0A1S8X9I1_OPIVI|nr:g-patch domain protein [Opisthorchis viverrini]